MIRLILLAVLILLLARAFWRLVDGILESAGGMPRGQMRGGGPAVKLVRDPVCGTFVAPGKALSSTAGGAIHYFCSEQCRSKFRSAS